VTEQGCDKTLCLNFASAKNAGGGFLGGSQAQEESLARSSALYATLMVRPEFPQLAALVAVRPEESEPPTTNGGALMRAAPTTAAATLGEANLVEQQPLTTLWEKLVKMGAKVVRRARYATFQKARGGSAAGFVRGDPRSYPAIR